MFLVGAQNVLKLEQGRALDFSASVLARRALAPGCRRLHMPALLLAQRGLDESRLGVVDAVALAVLLGRAVAQHFLKFVHRLKIDDGGFAVLQPRVAVA